ncbi:MAG: hypothetical protein D6732_04115 [Methanobacteriota archaeon]|nr:MAG: hypothetical protein D6732_04115 [Euryarchaeota archaeon]
MLNEIIFSSAIILFLMMVRSNSSKEENESLLKVKQHFSPYGKYSQVDGKFYRSNAEAKIARFLTKRNIKFIYEFPIKKTKFKTDFYLVDYDIYVEYWGLTDLQNRDGDRYRETHRRKIRIYQTLGLNLISIYPKDLNHLPRIFQHITSSP